MSKIMSQIHEHSYWCACIIEDDEKDETKTGTYGVCWRRRKGGMCIGPLLSYLYDKEFNKTFYEGFCMYCARVYCRLCKLNYNEKRSCFTRDGFCKLCDTKSHCRKCEKAFKYCKC